jgi:hypothetical protein
VKAKHLFEDGIQRRVNDGLDSSAVTWQNACLYAQGKLVINDRTKVLRQDGTFAPVVNAGSTQTNIGQSTQVGDLWSRVNVDLRNFAKVNGNLRTMGIVNPQAGATVSGLTVQNAALLQIPRLSLSVTFPGNNGVNQEAPDRSWSTSGRTSPSAARSSRARPTVVPTSSSASLAPTRCSSRPRSRARWLRWARR